MIRRVNAKAALLMLDESGMSTVEYAIGTIAAAAFGAILYTVVSKGCWEGFLTHRLFVMRLCGAGF